MDEGLNTRQTLTAMALGAVGALTLSRIGRFARRAR
jgi:membrane protein